MFRCLRIFADQLVRWRVSRHRLGWADLGWSGSVPSDVWAVRVDSLGGEHGTYVVSASAPPPPPLYPSPSPPLPPGVPNGPPPVPPPPPPRGSLPRRQTLRCIR